MKEKEKKKQEAEKKQKSEVIYNNLKILPVRFYDEDLDCFVTENADFIDILQVEGRDRDNLQDDEISYNIYLMTRFYKLYGQDLKFITMNFPVNTKSQQADLYRAYQATQDPVRRKWLQREINELQRLDENVQRREFFLMYFGKKREEFLKNRHDILNRIGIGRSRLVSQIAKEKKIQIVRKLCNMNTLILIDEHEEMEVLNVLEEKSKS